MQKLYQSPRQDVALLHVIESVIDTTISIYMEAIFITFHKAS